MPDQELAKLHFDYFLKATNYQFSDIIQRDKPDFLVTYQGMETGIELTEGCPEEQKRAEVIAKKNKLDHFCASELRTRPKDSRITNTQLLDTISESIAVNGELADIRWAHRLSDRIIEKSQKLENGSIQSFAKNWLVIVDTSPSMSSDRIDFMRAALMTALGTDFLEEPVFDLTYIVGARNIFTIDEHHTHVTQRKTGQG